MTRKPKQGNAPTPNAGNPFFHIGFSAADLFGIESSGGGVKQFCNTDQNYRERLNGTIALASEIVASNAIAYPAIPTVLAIRLHTQAIAKSHRPMHLVHEAEMAVLGHGNMNEMLVEATPREMRLLSHVVATRDTKMIRANLSVVADVVAWQAKAKLPQSVGHVDKNAVRAVLRSTGRLWIRLFRYTNQVAQAAAIDTVESLLRNGGAGRIVVPQYRGPPVYIVNAGADLSEALLDALLDFPGIRSMAPEPQAATEPSMLEAAELGQSTFQRVPEPEAPLVAVFDTGVHPMATLLNPWVVSNETFITSVDTNYEHGTKVSSLIADARGLNEQDSKFPRTACRIHDVCGLESGGAQIGDLILRLRQALANRPDIRIWNLSLGASGGIDDKGFSDFAQELDSLSDLYNVLFVVAAGNYLTLPRRGWPCDDTFSDRISSPADSVRALTVGSIAHMGSETAYVAPGEPASYSRRGPGPVFTPKPDLVHFGGAVEQPWSASMLGLKVMATNNSVIRDAGTSYAAPIVAAMAAQTWHAIDAGPRGHGLVPSPTLIKALMIHSAELASPPRSPAHRRYYGAGTPIDPMAALYDGSDSFTMVFDADLSTGAKWRKAPYPIPASLLPGGKLRAEIIITAVYAPPLDGSFGSEYVRANISVGFGLLEPDSDGVLQFKGKVPMKGEEGVDGYEEAQIEHGGKWSPVKIHRKVFSGMSGTSWALQASMLRRANEHVALNPLRTSIIVTLRSIDGHEDIYNEGARALAAANWVTQPLPLRIPVNVSI